MKKRKKLSDYFIDNKISITERDKSYVVISKNEIIWVVGFRISDDFKLTSDTKKIYQIMIC